MTAFLPAYLPRSKITTFPVCVQYTKCRSAHNKSQRRSSYSIPWTSLVTPISKRYTPSKHTYANIISMYCIKPSIHGLSGIIEMRNQCRRPPWPRLQLRVHPSILRSRYIPSETSPFLLDLFNITKNLCRQIVSSSFIATTATRAYVLLHVLLGSLCSQEHAQEARGRASSRCNHSSVQATF